MRAPQVDNGAGLRPMPARRYDIGMRHKVVHDYLSVDYDLVWDVVTVNLPQLTSDIERIVPPDETS